MVGGVSWTTPSRGAGAHVGQVLGFADVDFHVFLAGVQADDLTGIDLLGRADKGGAAGFGVLQRVRGGDAGFEGDQHAVAQLLQQLAERLVADRSGCS